jgi:hypothetical protein
LQRFSLPVWAKNEARRFPRHCNKMAQYAHFFVQFFATTALFLVHVRIISYLCSRKQKYNSPDDWQCLNRVHARATGDNKHWFCAP